MLGSKYAAPGGFRKCFQVVRPAPLCGAYIVIVRLRTGKGEVRHLLFRILPRPGRTLRTILQRGEKIGKLKRRSCHRSEHRHVRFLQVPFDVAQAISAVVVAAIRDDDYGAALVKRLAPERSHSGVNSIKKRSAAVGWRKKRGKSPLKVF